MIVPTADAMTAAEILRASPAGPERQILEILMAYAAGDSFGVAYEFLPEAVPVDVDRISTRGDWPLGGVSDDTDLSILTILASSPDEPRLSGDRFLSALRAELPRLRGLGPTTRAAVGLEPASMEGFAIVGTKEIGLTNGGVMRTALLGLGLPASRGATRRDLVTAMASVTHPAQASVDCSVLASGLFSRALETPLVSATDVVVDEVNRIASPSPRVREWIDTIDTWAPPGAGVSMDPVETLAAVVWVADRAEGVIDSLRLACELGGDTDTVAALAAGVVQARSSSSLLEIPWIDDVRWSEIAQLRVAATHLATMRQGAL